MNAVGTSGGAPSAEVRDRRRIRASRFFIGAAVAIVLSAFLPWTQETIKVEGVAEATITHKLSDGGVVYLVAFAGLYGWLGYLANRQRAHRGLLIGAWVVSAWMVVNIILLFNAVNDVQKASQTGDSSTFSDTIAPSAGLLPALIGAIAGVVATILLQRSRVRSVSAGPAVAAAVLSPDGRWSWDGAAWQPVPVAAPPPAPATALLSPDGRWSWDGSAWLAVPAVDAVPVPAAVPG
ncbi:MAG: hypothetical protein E6J20_18070 [Chloroflexi bacterium]|nr:MAG: hypothetical protein E6J20_18070 [Chloroflexota bacterium]